MNTHGEERSSAEAAGRIHLGTVLAWFDGVGEED
jgi:hypothetical protein